MTLDHRIVQLNFHLVCHHVITQRRWMTIKLKLD